MFTCIPCITTDAGAIPEIARDGETARVVHREDAADLARAIDAILDAPEDAARMAQRARAFVVPRYGLATMLDRMEGVFREAMRQCST
jgi:glycosyltransferase involved in cell wall biosynthesis